jgi:hypothetical protein
MSFASDCDAIPELIGASRPGLQALNPQDRVHVSKKLSTILTTGIDLDAALKVSQPKQARWDYGVAERRDGKEIVHWIELHPAQGGHCISQMQGKVAWLSAWLRGKPLAAYPRVVVWVAAGKSAFNARSPELRSLAQAGLRFAGGHYSI